MSEHEKKYRAKLIELIEGYTLPLKSIPWSKVSTDDLERLYHTLCNMDAFADTKDSPHDEPREREPTERIIELSEHWNALIVFAFKRHGKTEQEAMECADGIGSYYDINNLTHWKEIVNSILTGARWNCCLTPKPKTEKQRWAEAARLITIIEKDISRLDLLLFDLAPDSNKPNFKGVEKRE